MNKNMFFVDEFDKLGPSKYCAEVIAKFEKAKTAKELQRSGEAPEVPAAKSTQQ